MNINCIAIVPYFSSREEARKIIIVNGVKMTNLEYKWKKYYEEKEKEDITI